MGKDNGNAGESCTIRLTDLMLYDRIHTLSVEYSVSMDFLISAAVKRLLEDVEFVRGLRMGNLGQE